MKVLAIQKQEYIEVILVSDSGGYNPQSDILADSSTGDLISAGLAGKAVKVLNGVVVLDEDAEIARVQKIIDDKAASDALIPNRKYIARYGVIPMIKAQIAVINESKAMDIGAYLSDPIIQTIGSLIDNVSFQTAVIVLVASDLSAYYTNEEKQSIIDSIQGHLDSEL